MKHEDDDKTPTASRPLPVQPQYYIRQLSDRYVPDFPSRFRDRPPIYHYQITDESPHHHTAPRDLRIRHNPNPSTSTNINLNLSVDRNVDIVINLSSEDDDMDNNQPMNLSRKRFHREMQHVST